MEGIVTQFPIIKSVKETLSFQRILLGKLNDVEKFVRPRDVCSSFGFAIH